MLFDHLVVTVYFMEKILSVELTCTSTCTSPSKYKANFRARCGKFSDLAVPISPSLFSSCLSVATAPSFLACHVGPVPFHSSWPLVTLSIFLRWHPCSPSHFFVWLTPAFPCRDGQSFSAPRLTPGSWVFSSYFHTAGYL